VASIHRVWCAAFDIVILLPTFLGYGVCWYYWVLGWFHLWYPFCPVLGPKWFGFLSAGCALQCVQRGVLGIFYCVRIFHFEDSLFWFDPTGICIPNVWCSRRSIHKQWWSPMASSLLRYPHWVLCSALVAKRPSMGRLPWLCVGGATCPCFVVMISVILYSLKNVVIFGSWISSFASNPMIIWSPVMTPFL